MDKRIKLLESENKGRRKTTKDMSTSSDDSGSEMENLDRYNSSSDEEKSSDSVISDQGKIFKNIFFIAGIAGDVLLKYFNIGLYYGNIVKQVFLDIM